MFAQLRSSRYFRVVLVFVILGAIGSIPSVASASCVANLQSCSTTYGVNDTYFGSGGQLGTTGQGCSASYCAGAAVGELVIGNPNNGSSGNQVHAGSGSTTDRSPSLTFIVNGGPTNIGNLSTASTSATTATFSVKTYLASGYVVQISGNPPTSNSGHQLAPITTSGGATASPGTEQFGINLVANNTPLIGANPVCNPVTYCNYPTDVTVGSNYASANHYYYPSSGTDTLVTSTTSTGETDYTLSFIFNISTGTPSGSYTYTGKLVATSTF